MADSVLDVRVSSVMGTTYTLDELRAELATHFPLVLHDGAEHRYTLEVGECSEDELGLSAQLQLFCYVGADDARSISDIREQLVLLVPAKVLSDAERVRAYLDAWIAVCPRLSPNLAEALPADLVITEVIHGEGFPASAFTDLERVMTYRASFYDTEIATLMPKLRSLLERRLRMGGVDAVNESVHTCGAHAFVVAMGAVALVSRVARGATPRSVTLLQARRWRWACDLPPVWWTV